MRTLAIGDIHGCRRSLEALAEYAEFTEGDTIVTLGDYIDRGPDSKGAIDFLIDLGTRTNLVHLRGNHEIIMMESLWAGRPSMFWRRVGGNATLKSYGGEGFEEIPESHWNFIETSAPFYENDTHFFVHANADSNMPLEAQPDTMRYWETFGSPTPHQNGKIMVCGHTSQRHGIPINIGHAICIDTCAYGGGWLTCLDTESGIYWQTNEDGDRRSGDISDFLLE